MKRVRISGEDWSLQSLMVAEGFVERLRGLLPLNASSALLIETSSVHSIGMGRPFRAVALDEALTVVAVAVVEPWRVVSFRGARFIMELPLDVDPPRVGASLELADA